jgi:hypothetical protein
VTEERSKAPRKKVRVGMVGAVMEGGQEDEQRTPDALHTEILLYL